MGVEAFQVILDALVCALHFGGVPSAWRVDEDFYVVGVAAALERILQAEPGSGIRHAEAVVLQAFAEAAAEVREGQGIAIVRLNSNVDVLVFSCACAVIAARSRASGRLIIHDCRTND